MEIKRGDLVRYQENTVRWYLALVRRVHKDCADLQYFWGRRECVPLERLRTVDEYLSSRQRMLSLSRSALLSAWYGQSFDRLPGSRRTQVQKTLRKHGISFTGDGWDTPDGIIQLRRDDSVVVGGQTAADYELESLLPRWIEPPRMPPSSRDPLGLQARAEQLANEMLPGFTVFTFRAGYYGFLAWAIAAINKRTPAPGQTRRDMINRLERALVLCEFVQHGQGDDSCMLLGHRSKRRILQSGEDDRFALPDRILRNQNSAGAFRLYSTSLISFGFASADSERALEGLIPLSLTDAGQQLAHAFGRWVPAGLPDFAFGRARRSREELRKWGGKICFSHVAQARRNAFRDGILRGLLAADNEDGEKRYRTIKALMDRGLLAVNNHRVEVSLNERPALISDEDGDAAESLDDGSQGGLTNAEVMLRFYVEPATQENRVFQVAAVYELLSLGVSCMFGSLLHILKEAGRVRPRELAERLGELGPYSKVWRGASHRKPPPVEALLDAFYKAEDPLVLGQVGGALINRVLCDPVFKAVGSDLSDHPIYSLIEPLLRTTERPCLAEAFPKLAESMLLRHDQVSRNKNKQRWFFAEGDEFIKDDLQEMGTGFHAMRFPQLFRLCEDIGLNQQDLTHGF